MTAVVRMRAQARLRHDIGRAQLKRFGARLSRDPVAQGTVRVVANSLPKAGTHLLLKVLALLPGMYRIRLPLYRTTTPRFRGSESGTDRDEVVPVGVARTAPMSANDIKDALSRLPRGGFTIAHVPHSRRLAEILTALDYRMIVMIRDPRDVVVSSADYLPEQPKNALWPYFSAMSRDERIMASLQGLEDAHNDIRLPDVRKRLEGVLSWRQEPFVLTIRYEDLVGPQGGGSVDAQLQAVNSIARHVDLDLPPELVRDTAANAFGATTTFNAGRLGRWRESFTSDHIAVAGPLLSDLLVELGYEADQTWCR